MFPILPKIKMDISINDPKFIYNKQYGYGIVYSNCEH